MEHNMFLVNLNQVHLSLITTVIHLEQATFVLNVTLKV